MKFNRPRLILGLYVLAFIVVTELVTGHLGLPAWPAFVAWVLFFAEHMNPKRAPHVLIGAAAGIGLVMLAPLVIGLLAHLIGAEWGRLIYILAAVYAIFAFGEMIPLVLNYHTFMFLLIGATIVVGRIVGAPGAAEAAH